MEPLPEQRLSSIKPSGKREKVLVADVTGLFQKYKTIVFALLVVVYISLPLIKIGGNPAVFIDIQRRQFFLFGLTFNAQDAYLVFFIITGTIFALIFITAVFGRVWCGWACPQTVFLEGFYRKIERWIEGNKSQQILLRKSPWNSRKVSKFLTKHFLFILLSLFISHVFLSYFVSLDHLFVFMTQNPMNHPVAFTWAMVLALIIYGNFAWFREQLCLIVCPYGRLQSALIDDDSLIIGYDQKRGEPRGKKSSLTRGDCIDCHRCIEVCPTGIDIRNGMQLECVGCANCIDACNDIMKKIGQPMGLIRYDSYNGFEGKKRKILRPRIYLYTGLFILGVMVFSFFLLQRHPFEANFLRLPGAPYSIENGKIRNSWQIHLVNKSSATSTFEIIPRQHPQMDYILPQKEIILNALEGKTVPLFVFKTQGPKQEKGEGKTEVVIDIMNKTTGQSRQQKVIFLGP